MSVSDRKVGAYFLIVARFGAADWRPFFIYGCPITWRHPRNHRGFIQGEL